MQRLRASRARLEVVAVLGVIVVLGLLAAPLPLGGDQALFAAGARQLADGDVLYRDWWDIKQPGIYLFYVIGGSLVGYSEIALHLFELAYQLVLAVVLIVTLRGRIRPAWIVPLVPLIILGTYYLTSEPIHFGQIECLVGLPLYLSLWCSVRALDPIDAAPSRRFGWLFVSGLLGGVVLVLKIVFAPILGVFWLLAAWELARAVPTHRWRAAASALGAAALGVLIPVGLVVAYVVAYGQLETVRWIYFEVTPRTTEFADRPLDRLLVGGFKNAARWAVPLALAAIGLVATARRGWDRLDRGLVVWLVLGVPLFLMQHWWIYGYVMFLVPIGIFAGHGLETLVRAWPRLRAPLRVALGAAVVVLLVPATMSVARTGGALVRNGFGLTADDRAGLHEELVPDYGPAAAWAEMLRTSDAPDRGVYVLGNPLHLYLADRRTPVSVNGWSPQQYPPEYWERLRRELARTRPTELVVDRFSRSIMRERAPATLRLIKELYEPVGRSGKNTWYRLRAAAAGSG